MVIGFRTIVEDFFWLELLNEKRGQQCGSKAIFLFEKNYN